ncbi:hypothetical protein TNCV_4068241 [Trichonephila clavipes]|nr:hypothetical protein TNCV_4068241 [Trichonephila clavipes]
MIQYLTRLLATDLVILSLYQGMRTTSELALSLSKLHHHDNANGKWVIEMKWREREPMDAPVSSCAQMFNLVSDEWAMVELKRLGGLQVEYRCYNWKRIHKWTVVRDVVSTTGDFELHEWSGDEDDSRGGTPFSKLSHPANVSTDLMHSRFSMAQGLEFAIR